MEDSKLISLVDQFEKAKETRGSRGGLGRIKGTPGSGVVFRARDATLPDTPLYRNFVRGGTLGGDPDKKVEVEQVKKRKIEQNPVTESTLNQVFEGSSSDSDSDSPLPSSRPPLKWRNVVDAILLKRGEVSWKKMKKLGARVYRSECKRRGQPCPEGDDILGNKCLAAVPPSYLCGATPVIRRQ